MDSILRGLNVAQKAAVTSSASVLQVLAPPGSGKTKTLTSRVAYLLAHHGYAPSNVICCTFTIKASREMRERLRGMIGGELESSLILGTFHSICRRYLVTYGHLIGIPKNFGIADADDSLNIIKRAIKRLKLTIDPRSARSRISHRKARGKRLDDDKRPVVKNQDTQEFATIWTEYQEALDTSNLLDYDDLLLKCVDLLQQHPTCVSNVEALLIDEFQDTNIVQFQLMKLLASAKRRITIVGDPDQSIYGFRSAEIENLRRMRAYYPESVVINLEENYRSSSAVLRLAQQVIEQDNDRPDKKLKSTHKYGTLPVLRKLPNPYEEARWIAAEIKRLVAMTGDLLQYSDLAILLRSAFLSLNIEKALASQGIPYRMVGGRRFFDRVEVRILLDYLRTISHPDNTSALLAIINTPKRKIGDSTVKDLVRLAEENKETLWSIVVKVQSGEIKPDKKLSKPAEQGLSELTATIKKARKKLETMVPVEAPGKLIELVVNELRYRDFLKREYPDDHEERWENVKELLTQATDATLQFNVGEENLPQVEGVTQTQADGAQEVLSRFLANVVLSTEVESEDGEEKQRITISTIHSAKGLEWPVVFIPAVYEGSIPHSRAEDTDEERRLLYVAITRAQSLLYLTFPVMQQRGESESILSQFLPSDIKPMISQVGPVFHDSIVEDIASVLRRPAPSQESLARGLQGLKENESAEDDIWPADGSHRRSQERPESAYPSFVLQPGQSLSDALRVPGQPNQKSNYSTLSYSASTTMSNLSNYSTSNMSIGFTTANHHLKTVPQLPEKRILAPSLVKSNTDPTDLTTKKPKLVKALSSQGSITSFFSQGTLKAPSESAASVSNRLQQQNRSHQVGFGTAQSNKAVTTTTENSVLKALSNHQVSGAANSAFRRPRPALDTTTENDMNQHRKRNHYSAFSSPPSQDDSQELKKDKPTTQYSAPLVAENSLANSSRSIPSQPSNINVHTGSLHAKSYTNTHTHTNNETHVHTLTRPSSTLHTTTTMSLVNNNNNNNSNNNNNNVRYPSIHRKIHGTLHSSLTRVTPTTTMTPAISPTSAVETDTSGSNTLLRRRTLGVRRSVNGWEGRKHR